MRSRKGVYERKYPQTKAVAGSELAQKRWADATENNSTASFAEDTAAKIGAVISVLREKIDNDR